MNERQLAVVGGGQMGRALVGGMINQGVLEEKQIRLAEPNQQALTWWSENHPDVAAGSELPAAVADADTVLLAVKPDVIPAVAKQRSRFWSGKLVISIAAGVSLESLAELIGHKRVVRVMPNTPSLVGEGASAFCCGSDVNQEDIAWINAMLGSVGLVVQVEQSQMDAVTGLSGSGPAYVCLMVEALADGGVMSGLPRPLAMKLATQTVLGTARMIAETGRHPAELKDAVASPGGTTIAGIGVLEQNGVRGALVKAVAAAARRSRELGQKD